MTITLHLWHIALIVCAVVIALEFRLFWRWDRRGRRP
jgi:hypothetical protein